MSYTNLQDIERTARKPHICIWCGEAINAGQKYQDRRGVFDGELQANRFHPECASASDRFFHEEREDCFMPYEFKRGTTECK